MLEPTCSPAFLPRCYAGTSHAFSCRPQLQLFWYQFILAPHLWQDHSFFCAINHFFIPFFLMNSRLGFIVQWCGHLSFINSLISLQGYSLQKQQNSTFLSFEHCLNLQFFTESSTLLLWQPSQSVAPHAPQYRPQGPYCNSFIVFLYHYLFGKAYFFFRAILNLYLSAITSISKSPVDNLSFRLKAPSFAP